MDGGRALVAILAGGAGRRLGTGKPTRRLAGRPLLCYPLAAAREADLEAVVVTKRGVALPALEAEVLYEADHPRHPLCGILAALALAARRSQSTAVLAVACDMPFLNGPLLDRLAHPAPEDMGRAVVAERHGQLEPLLGRYLPAHRPVLERALQERRSLRSSVELLAPRRMGDAELRMFGDPERLLFNVNDTGELAIAEGWLGRDAPERRDASVR